MTLTQSFLKSMLKYLYGDLCGHIMQHCFVLGKLLPPTKAMKVGIYFEFCLTGALPKDGQVPQPQWMKDGKDFMEPYRKARSDAKYIKGILDSMGLKFVHFGHKLINGPYSGTVDIICEATRDLVLGGFEIKKGEQIVIDVKYSGLLEDYRSEMGWQFTDKQKEYHKIQAIHYHIITGLRFFYLVVDSSHKEKDDDGISIPPPFKFFHTPISEIMIKEHEEKLNSAFDKFRFHRDIGFTPRPIFSECNKCALREGCKDRALLPSVEVIDLNVD